MTVSHIKVLYPCIGSFDPLGTSLTLKEFLFREKSLGPRVSRILGSYSSQPDLRIRDGILFVKDGKIEKVGKNIEISPSTANGIVAEKLFIPV